MTSAGLPGAVATGVAAPSLSPIRAVAIFVGIPLLICAVVTLAVWIPVGLRLGAAGSVRDRDADRPLTHGVLLEHQPGPDGQEDKTPGSST